MGYIKKTWKFNDTMTACINHDNSNLTWAWETEPAKQHKRLHCMYCGCISDKKHGTCVHCGAPLEEM